MKKHDLIALALLGMSAGLIAGGCQQQQGKNTRGNNNGGKTSEQMTSDTQAFYNSLSPEAQRKFMSLDSKHKTMAMQMVNHQCNGMGGCESTNNSQNGSSAKDPNQAVDIQYQSQMNQRQGNTKTTSVQTSGPQNGTNNNASAPAAPTPPPMSAEMQTFYNSLNSDAQRKFMALDAQHKQAAMQMMHPASSSSAQCGGPGGCGGSGPVTNNGEPTPRSNNEAVDIQYNLQMQQRRQMQQNMNTGSSQNPPPPYRSY